MRLFCISKYFSSAITMKNSNLLDRRRDKTVFASKTVSFCSCFGKLCILTFRSLGPTYDVIIPYAFVGI